jgi:hypothetical protein
MNPVLINILGQIGRIAISQVQIAVSQIALLAIEKAFDSLQGRERNDQENRKK